jgi:hypothetical protein
MANSHPKRLPFGPIEAAITAAMPGHNGIHGWLTENQERNYWRAKAVGLITPAFADELAIRVLGLHPSLIYGDDWWLDDCG